MDPRAVVNRFFGELWNRRNFDIAAAVVAPGCVTHQLRSASGEQPTTSRGPAAMVAHIREWVEGFPDIHAEVEATVVEGDRVVSWVAMRGTHEGPWHGLVPTGHAVVIRNVVMHRVEAGRIAEDWVLIESFGFIQQLGLVDPLPRILARHAMPRAGRPGA
jgi:steroid delta-isomerase-like uncharacterized protein